MGGVETREGDGSSVAGQGGMDMAVWAGLELTGAPPDFRLAGARWARSAAPALRCFAGAVAPGPRPEPDPWFRQNATSWHCADSPEPRPGLSHCPEAGSPRTIRRDARPEVFLSIRRSATLCRAA